MRKSAIGVFCLVLAVLAGGHAASNALASDNPQLAARLSPFAAPANQRLSTLTQRVVQGADGRTVIDVGNALPFAAAAYRVDPLSGAALSILARSRQAGEERNAVLDAAARTTRRETLLQAALLERQVGSGNFDDAVATLDRTLTVRPQYTDQIMPPFVQALQDEAQLARFGEILESDPVWEPNFFRFASREPRLAGALGPLRIAQGNDEALDERTNRAIIHSLIEYGEFDAAMGVYNLAGGTGLPPATGEWDLNWNTRFPPFDWGLQDSPGEYARIDDGTEMRIFLRRGRGGQLARRSFVMPSGVHSILIEHDIRPALRTEDMKLTLECEEGRRVIFEGAFEASPTRFAIGQDGQPCEFYRLTISGRAWSSGDEVSGTISRIVID